jgi:hypothetical protein
MKNFPHQFNDLSKLFNALLEAQTLVNSDLPLTDENFGEQLTKAGIYTYRNKSLTVNQYLKVEKAKPAANRGYLTVSRDIRRFFELLNFIVIRKDKYATITQSGQDILNTLDVNIRKDLWKNALLNLSLPDNNGNVSHPYRILIRLVNSLPGIETSKLMLALEAENDSEAEFDRVMNLAQNFSIPEIISIIGTSESMADNAVKILPGIGEQLGHIKRKGNVTFPNDNVIENIQLPDFGVEDEKEETHPFDPEKISIDTKGITMDTCLRRLEQKTIVLAPDFQRNEVWTNEQKCRLIESLMLKIPIPMFYVSADEKGIFSVVDGLQRLSTIRSFILGDDYLSTKNPSLKGEGFKLKYLEFWGDKYNNYTFNDLPINIQNRILETEFTFTIINPGTPEEVKRNVFKRINTGGAPLTSQEIRHALYTGTSTILLQQLSKRIEFLNATNYSVSSDRMMDRELILRFLSFSIRSFNDYPRSNDMDSFLSDSMRIINLMPSLSGKDSLKILPDEAARAKILITDVDKLNKLFINGMLRSQAIFGSHAFRKSYGSKRRTQINKSLFEVWSVLLSQISETQFTTLLGNKNLFFEQYIDLLEDVDFVYTISRDSLKFPSVKFRFETLRNILNKYTNDN